MGSMNPMRSYLGAIWDPIWDSIYVYTYISASTPDKITNQTKQFQNKTRQPIQQQQSMTRLISTSLHKHGSVGTVFALFVGVFNSLGAELFKYQCQIAWQMCHNTRKTASNTKIMARISATQ